MVSVRAKLLSSSALATALLVALPYEPATGACTDPVEGMVFCTDDSPDVYLELPEAGPEGETTNLLVNTGSLSGNLMVPSGTEGVIVNVDAGTWSSLEPAFTGSEEGPSDSQLLDWVLTGGNPAAPASIDGQLSVSGEGTVLNLGSFNGGIDFLGADGSARILNAVGASFTGTIDATAFTGGTLDGYAEIINFGAFAGDVMTGDSDDVVANLGQIAGLPENLLSDQGPTDVEILTLMSQGLQEGDVPATYLGNIALGAGHDAVFNAGTLTGSISLWDGDDVVVNSGTILGTYPIAVNLGDDNNLLINYGTIEGVVYAGDGLTGFEHTMVWNLGIGPSAITPEFVLLGSSPEATLAAMRTGLGEGATRAVILGELEFVGSGTVFNAGEMTGGMILGGNMSEVHNAFGGVLVGDINASFALGPDAYADIYNFGTITGSVIGGDTETYVLNLGDIANLPGLLYDEGDDDDDGVPFADFNQLDPIEQAVLIFAGAGASSGSRPALLDGSITTGAAADLVFNTGRITGDVSTGAGRDTVISNGRIDGNVDLGDGDDLLLIGTGGNDFGGTVTGGTGNDRLVFVGTGTYAGGFTAFELVRVIGNGWQTPGTDPVPADPITLPDNQEVTVDDGGQAGAIEGTAGNSVTIGGNSTVAGDVTFTGGGNVVTVGTGAQVSGDIQTGAGNNTITLGENTTVGGNIDLGGSDNALTIGRGAILAGNVSLGAGNGTLTLGDNVAVIPTGPSTPVVDGGGSGALTLQGGGTLAASVQNFQTLTVTDSGAATATRWNVTGTVSVASQATIASSTLAVNGTLAAPVVTIGANGRLGGSGVIAGDVTNSGTLAPGNSPGTLTIAGNYTNAGNLDVEIEGTAPGQFDRILVGGDLVITGGVVNVQASRNYQIGADYAFLTYGTGGAGTRTGSFAGASDNLPYAKAQLSYDDAARQVVLRLAADVDALAADVPAGNQRAVATALPTTGDLATAVFTLPADRLGAALNTLSGEVGTGIASISAFGGQQFLGSLAGGPSLMPGSGSSSRQSAAWTQPQYASSQPALIETPATAGPNGAQGSVWASGYGTMGEMGAKGDASGFDYRVKGGATGLTIPVGKDFDLGAAIGFSKTDLSGFRNGDDAEADSYQAAVYGTWHQGPLSLRATAGYAFHEFEHTRSIAVGSIARQASADYHGHEIFGQLSAGYRVDLGALDLQPQLALQYGILMRDGYTESGADSANLTVEDETSGRGRALAALTLGHDYGIDGDRTLRVEATAGVAREFGDVEGRQTASFAGTGALFTVEGADRDRTSGILGLNVTGDVTETVQAFGGYGFTGNGDAREHTVLGGLRLRW